MKPFRFLNSWQGWLAGLLALALFLVSPFLIRAYDPTAGVWDGGVLQWLLLALVMAALGVGAMWTLWQAAFPSTDKAADQALSEWFEGMTAAQKWWAVQGTFMFFLLYWVLCCAVAPR
jgi:hypothetical protein